MTKEDTDRFEAMCRMLKLMNFDVTVRSPTKDEYIIHLKKVK